MSYVLIVDDDHNVAQTLSDMVGLFDWTTLIVTSPRAAIEALHRNPPALILLDLNMPGVDGMEVCRYIKRDPISGSTPVVFVTAEDDPGTKVRATAAGAMDYLVKPVDIDRLEQVLERVPLKPSKQDVSSTGKLSDMPSGSVATLKLPLVPRPAASVSPPESTPAQPAVLSPMSTEAAQAAPAPTESDVKSSK